MKLIIIYKSKTGFTKKYAETIAKKLNCDAIDIKEISKIDIRMQDTVIYGSRVHAGIIDGLSKMKKLLASGNIKNLVVFATGATPKDAKDLIETIWTNNFTTEEAEKIPHFYLQSGLCYEKMGFLDHTIMKMVAKMMEKKKDKDSNETGFLQATTKSYDISSDEYVEPLVTFLKKEDKSPNK